MKFFHFNISTTYEGASVISGSFHAENHVKGICAENGILRDALNRLGYSEYQYRMYIEDMVDGVADVEVYLVDEGDMVCIGEIKEIKAPVFKVVEDVCGFEVVELEDAGSGEYEKLETGSLFCSHFIGWGSENEIVISMNGSCNDCEITIMHNMVCNDTQVDFVRCAFGEEAEAINGLISKMIIH